MEAEMSRRRAQLVLAALAIAVVALGKTAVAADPAELDIGWVNVGAASNEALMFTEQMVEKNLPNTKVKWVEFTGGSAGIAALNAGDIQVMTEVGLPPTVSAISKGLDFKIVWVNDIYLTSEGLVVRNSANIKSIADLAGKKVATMVGTSSGYMLHAALTSGGLDESKVDVINMDPPSMQAAWKRGELDAAYIWAPALVNMAADGGTILATNADFQDRGSSIDMMLVRGEFAKTYPDAVVAVLKAENDSINELKNGGDAALQKMADYLKIPLDQAKVEFGGIQLMNAQEQLSEKGLGQGAGIANSRITKAIQAAGQYLVGVGSLKAVPDNIPQYVDTSFIEKLPK
jgi:taurine transport system substrate-binding protein